MGQAKPVVAFPRRRFGSGKTVLTDADIELRKCPACKGTGRKTLAQMGSPFQKHTSLGWQCELCAAVGSIATSEQTYKDLQEHYG